MSPPSKGLPVGGDREAHPGTRLQLTTTRPSVTPASLLLGLSRKPLSPADESRAARLTPPHASPARKGLALLSVDGLAYASADLSAESATSPPQLLPPPPPHPDYGSATPTLVALAEDMRALQSAGLPRFLRRRGLLSPAPMLPFELSRLKRRRRLGAEDFVGLGPRGAYLMPLVAQAPYREATQFSPQGARAAFAKTASQRAVKTRDAILGYVLGLLGAIGLDQETKQPYRAFAQWLVAEARWPSATTRAAQVLLERDRLAAVVAPEVLAQALTSGAPAAPLPPLASYRLLRAAALHDVELRNARDAARGRAEEYLSSFGRAARVPAAEDLPRLATAAYVLRASATAARVFGDCVRGDDRLQREHPALGVLLAAMDAGDFARSVNAFAAATPRGWGHPLITTWLGDTDHRLSPDDSERLVVDALTAYTPGPPALAQRFPLRLDPCVAEVLHAYEERGRGGATARRLGSVLAQAARISAVYGPLT